MLHLLLLDGRREHGVGQSLRLLFGHGGGLDGGCWVGQTAAKGFLKGGHEDFDW